MWSFVEKGWESNNSITEAHLEEMFWAGLQMRKQACKQGASGEDMG